MANGVASPVALQCEYADNPIGIDEVLPRLSWRMADTRRGAKQTAYQVRVGTKPELADAWDSGKVETNQSAQVVYAGIKLKSRGRYYWQVKYWDQAGVESPWSAPAFFEMGLLTTREWKAQWINVANVFDKTVCPPAKYVRRSFIVRRPLRSARLYITAKGLYVPMLNGQRIAADYFAPGWSDYRKRIRYQTHDVTAQIVPGRNMIGAMLGEGWYSGNVAWTPRGGYGENPALLAELHLEYADGSYEAIRTDNQWTGTIEGPIRSNDFLHGEHYDARKDLGPWCTPPADPSASDGGVWQPVRVEAHDKTPLEAYVGPAVQRSEELMPREAWRTPEGNWIFDLGQNMVGFARLKVKGAAGQEITLRFAEILNPDRALYVTNLRSAKVTDRYICKGDGVEQWEPLFTFHGFRYVEVAGLLPGQTPGLDTVQGVVIHSATPRAGAWRCSNESLNQLQRNIEWGQRGNFVEIPTDCPQRDERLGWMGDAQVFIRTASYNCNVASFFTRWMVEVDDAQRPDGAYTDVSPLPPAGGLNAGIAAWADAGIICPWTVYQVYGDTRILERHYDAMKKFIAFMVKKWPDGERHKDEWTYGDWLAIDSWTPRELIGCAYFAYSASLMQQIATVLKKDKDALRFARLFEKLKKAFNRIFVTAGGYLAGDSQTAYVLALRFGLLPEEKIPQAIHRLTLDLNMRKVLTTGFVGVNLLLPTLSQIGRDDLAFMLLTSDKFPSWLYSVKNGATTIWERWDGWTTDKGFQTPTMNSFNHYAYGSCGEWMFAAAAGIDLDPAAPGYQHLRIHPRIGGDLTWVEAHLDTLYGRVETHWKSAEGKLEFRVRIPANTTATVAVPAGSVESVTESGQAVIDAAGISQVRLEQGKVLLHITSGEYLFSVAEASGKPVQVEDKSGVSAISP